MKSIERNKLETIQALRGFAASAVVVCHLRDLFRGTPIEEGALHWLMPGAFGVDLFFIISGFIITLASSSYQSTDYKKFLVKRVLRICPPYFFWTILYVILINRNDLSAIDIIPLLKSFLFIPLNLDAPIYFGSAALPQGWTLNYEAYFYIVFAVCIFIGRARYIALLAWFALTTFALTKYLGLTDPKPAIIGFGYVNLMMQPMMIEFIFGVLCAMLYKSGILQIKNERLCKTVFFMAMMIPFVCLVLHPEAWDHGPYKFGFYIMISFFLITLCLNSAENVIKIPKIMIKIGNMSFSMYLCHIFVMTAVESMITPVGYSAFERAILVVAIFIPLVYFTSSMSFYLLESKLHDFMLSKISKRNTNIKQPQSMG